MRERIRSLLVDRFQLSVRRVTSEQSVFLLGVAKSGHKLEITDERKGISRRAGFLSGNGATMEMLATVLPRVLGRPVLDRTGLTEMYKFKMEWTEDANLAARMKDEALGAPESNPDLSGQSIFSAIQNQLGLKLESGKGPVETLVIERLEKPSAN